MEPALIDLELVEAVARRVVEMLEARSPAEMATAADVARLFAIDRNWVYAHADQLGAIRLGTGPRARLRFELTRVAESLGRAPEIRPVPKTGEPRKRGRPRKSVLPAGVDPLVGRRERHT